MDGEETLISVGQAVAGRQKQYDSALQEGELYKAGSCLAVLVQRSPVFISESDYSLDVIEGEDVLGEDEDPGTPGESAYYTFRVVRGGFVGVVGEELVDTRFFDTVGAAKIYPAEDGADRASKPWQYQTVGLDYAEGEIGNRYYTASSFPQIFRCALGNISLNRPTRFFEIGIRSTVAMQVQGICNFADVPVIVPLFDYNTVTGINRITANATNLVNGTYTVSPNINKGTGLTVQVVVSGNTITSETIVDAGTKYRAGDTFTISIPRTNGNTYTATYSITSVATVETGTAERPGYRAINWKAADALDGVPIEDNLTNAVFTSGTVTAPEKRYSFFRLSFRADPTVSVEFSPVSNYLFAVSGAKETPSFNFVRFVMDGDASWEIRLEPVSSWEVRTQPFRVIELQADNAVTSSLLELPFTGGTAYVKGRYVDTNSFNEIFDIQGLRPKREIGISWTEGAEGDYSSPTDGTYLDRYARAAEFFVYDEINTSCASAPEHEITYVNVIQPNETTPLYDNLCLVGINVRASQEWSQFSQFSAYVTEGIKVNTLLGEYESTHLFPEILYDFMTNTRYGLGNEISVEQIDTASFTAAAQFCLDNRFFYDGPKLNNANWRQWAADTAATHCLLLIERGGIFYLEQAIPEQPEIRGLFTAGNCISMELQMAEAEQREPVSLSVKYRTEQYGGGTPSESTDPSYGLFPEPQERIVYNTAWGEGIIESIDMSDYCTSENHAIKAARYIIGARKLSDHTVKIATTYEALTSSLAPGDFIKVALDYTHYNQFINGAVTADGKLISSTSLSDGSYSVVYWTGEQDTQVVEGTLNVSNGGTTASPTGIVFTVVTSEILTRTYRIDSIQPSDDGYEIEAVHTPMLSNGTLQLYAEWSDSSYWTEL